MATPLLELSNVVKSYEAPGGAAPLRVLDGISLRIAPGDAVAVVGPSGSGKSTLLNLMGGLDRPTEGAVTLAGRNLAALTDDELAAVRSSEVGFVFQLHHLLPQCTVLENVLIPTLAPHAPGAGDAVERASALLERAGLGGRLHHLPGQLSGGERQRVAVVRALINTPKVILADEPTGALDHASATHLADVLAGLNAEGITLVLVTHAHDIAARMSRRFELRDGALSEL